MSSSVNFLADKQGLNAVAPSEHTDPLPCRKEFTGQFPGGMQWVLRLAKIHSLLATLSRASSRFPLQHCHSL